jgi:hypothetical protein
MGVSQHGVCFPSPKEPNFIRINAGIEEGRGSGASYPQGSGADICRKEAKRLAHDGDRETEGCSYIGGLEVCWGCSYIGGLEVCWGRCFGGPVGSKRCLIGRGVEPKVEDAARGGANWAAESLRAEAMGDYFITNAILLCGEYQLNRSSVKYICPRGCACIEDLLAQK